MFENILPLYGLSITNTIVQPFGDGLINRTWKVTTNQSSYILQQVNTSVFHVPENIDHNLSLLKSYLSKKASGYLFVSPIKSLNGSSLVKTAEGYFRLSPFVMDSVSLNALTRKEEAFEAARQFGKFSRLLAGFDVAQLQLTIPDFHNLALRYAQFKTACTTANPERIKKAAAAIDFIHDQQHLVQTYLDIVADPAVPFRVIHHDTKINNVLFDQQNHGICVIDLDTVMPGYFISDVGDMMRTYLCAATEEETDLEKIQVREEFYQAIYAGYMSEMENILSPVEKQHFSYAGKFMIYMQAIRFLTDYLQDDSYYGARYEAHNLNRANNQITLLKAYIELENKLKTQFPSSIEVSNQQHT